MQLNYEKIMKEGLTVLSSGTTGKPKEIYRSPKQLISSFQYSLAGQKINKDSRVLTVTKLTHAGGSLLQTLPAMHIGAPVNIVTFNPYKFLDQIKDYTHTFLPPAHMKTITKTKSWDTCDLSGLRIVGGSDRVSWDLIEAYVSKGAIVQPNWGMSEVGPFCINAEYGSKSKIDRHKKHQWILGDNFSVEWEIVDGQLFVSGEQCVYNGWFATGDLVFEDNGVLYYRGRK